MTLLGEGSLTLRTETGTHTIDVRGGFAQVVSDVVRVVAEHAVAEGAE